MGALIYAALDTEIDWRAYMDQVAMYLAGERDYTAIKGGTGPLVYPAAHLYIYSALYHVTDGGKDILLAQIIFGGLYLASLTFVMASYRLAEVRLLFFIFFSPFLSRIVWSLSASLGCETEGFLLLTQSPVYV